MLPPSLPSTPRTWYFAGLGALIATLLGGLLAVWLLFYQATPFSMESQGKYLGLIALLFMAGGGLGAALLLVDALKRKKWLPLLLVGLPLCGICFLVLVYIFFRIGMMEAEKIANQQASPTEIGNATVFEGMDAVSTPIPNTHTQRTAANTQQLMNDWYSHVLLQPLLEGPDKEAPWMPQASAFTRNMTLKLAGDPGQPDRNSLMAEAKALMNSGCEHPLILAMASQVETEAPYARELAQKACAIFDSQPDAYPPFWRFWSRVALSHCLASYEPNKGVIRENDQAAIQLIPSLLNASVFPEQYTNRIVDAFLNIDNSKFFERSHAGIVEALKQSDFVPKWLLLSLEGQSEIRLAWEARGSGWASSVTEEGWKNFFLHLEKARNVLEESWQIDPKQPFTALAMITVARGQGNDDAAVEMRRWFDRCVEAQFDYIKAYSSLLSGLKPRWHGSHQAQFAFGKLCANTGRYDTDVPLFFLDTVLDIANETNGLNALYMNPDVSPVMDSMLNGYLQAGNAPRPADYYRTLQIYFACVREDLATASTLLKEIDSKPNPDACNAIEWPPADMVFWIQNHTFSAAATYKEAYAADAKRDIPQATTLYRKLLEASDITDMQRNAFSSRISSLELEGRIQSGEWTDFMPPPDFSGWRVLYGQWTRESDYLECRSGTNGLLLYSLARIGPDFKIRGEIEFVSSTNNEFQAGALWGFPKDIYGNFSSFRIKSNNREGRIVCFSEGFSEPLSQRPLNPGNTFSFQLTCLKNRYYLEINGLPIISDFSAEDMHVPKEPFYAGLGGFYDQNETVVRFRKLEISQTSNR